MKKKIASQPWQKSCQIYNDNDKKSHKIDWFYFPSKQPRRRSCWSSFRVTSIYIYSGITQFSETATAIHVCILNKASPIYIHIQICMQICNILLDLNHMQCPNNFAKLVKNKCKYSKVKSDMHSIFTKRIRQPNNFSLNPPILSKLLRSWWVLEGQKTLVLSYIVRLVLKPWKTSK